VEVSSVRHHGYALLAWLLLLGAIVSLVFGHLIMGLVLGLLALLRFRVNYRHRPGFLIDQRGADQEGPPTVR